MTTFLAFFSSYFTGAVPFLACLYCKSKTWNSLARIGVLGQWGDSTACTRGSGEEHSARTWPDAAHAQKLQRHKPTK
jgi:hypothetical protein